jgi:hypothetical protein
MCEPFRFGVPRMWLFGGNITWSKSCVNIAAAKKATALRVSLPVFSRSWRIGVGRTSLALDGVGFDFAADAGAIDRSSVMT